MTLRRRIAASVMAMSRAGKPATHIAAERRAAAAEALFAFTLLGAHKLYVTNGSQTVPRCSP